MGKKEQIESEITEIISMMFEYINEEDIKDFIISQRKITEIMDKAVKNPLIRMGIHLYGRRALLELEEANVEEIYQLILKTLKSTKPEIYKLLKERKEWFIENLNELKKWLKNKAV